MQRRGQHGAIRQEHAPREIVPQHIHIISADAARRARRAQLRQQLVQALLGHVLTQPRVVGRAPHLQGQALEYIGQSSEYTNKART